MDIVVWVVLDRHGAPAKPIGQEREAHHSIAKSHLFQLDIQPTQIPWTRPTQEGFRRLPRLGLLPPPAYHIRKVNSDTLPYPEMDTL
jgi:hypothetical protein